MPHRSPQAHFVIQNALTSSRLQKKVDQQLSIHGISFTEYLIMHHLSTAALKTMRRIELAERVGISASGVTRLIAPMEKIGLVEKEANPRDARQSLVKLSRTGERLYKEASVSFGHCAESALGALSARQLETLIELSDRLQ